MLLGLGVLFGWSRIRRAPAPADAGPRRVAVLPFDNLATADKVYFAEGITDEIRAKLATVAGLQVTARTSSAQYAGSTKRSEEIGRELGVAYLLSWTVRWDQDGGQSGVRVSPELIDAATGAAARLNAGLAALPPSQRLLRNCTRSAFCLDVSERRNRRT